MKLSLQHPFIFRWVFWTIHYDIQYTVLYQESKDKLYCQTIRDMERINAQTLPVDGFIKCFKPGVCKFQTLLLSPNTEIRTQFSINALQIAETCKICLCVDAYVLHHRYESVFLPSLSGSTLVSHENNKGLFLALRSSEFHVQAAVQYLQQKY